MTEQELMIAKLRYLLYDAILELAYIQEYEDGWPRELIASAKGKQIVARAMELLDIKDLSCGKMGMTT